MTSVNDCPRLGKWNGCCFKARYDLSAADLSQFESIKCIGKDFAEVLRKKTYVRDVCIRCGRTIERVQS